MSFRKKLKSSNKDEYYTPIYAIEPLLEFLIGNEVIWCPFDLDDMAYPRFFKENGFEIVNTHINQGYDFFKYEPDYYDVIISNAPYSLKNEVLTRLFSLKRPFCVLFSDLGLYESQLRFNLFKNNRHEKLIFNKRIDFLTNYKDGNSVKKGNIMPTGYVCRDFLPNTLTFREINKKGRLI